MKTCLDMFFYYDSVDFQMLNYTTQ